MYVEEDVEVGNFDVEGGEDIDGVKERATSTAGRLTGVD